MQLSEARWLQTRIDSANRACARMRLGLDDGRLWADARDTLRRDVEAFNAKVTHPALHIDPRMIFDPADICDQVLPESVSSVGHLQLICRYATDGS